MQLSVIFLAHILKLLSQTSLQCFGSFLFFLQRSLCSEMAQELRFAVKCVGSSRKPKFKRRCSKCKKGKDCDDASHVCDVPLTDSANGIIQLRDVRRSPGPSTANRRYNSDFSRPKDYSGEYLHVDYSDGEV